MSMVLLDTCGVVSLGQHVTVGILSVIPGEKYISSSDIASAGDTSPCVQTDLE